MKDSGGGTRRMVSERSRIRYANSITIALVLMSPFLSF